MQPDRLTQLERAGLVPRLTDGQRDVLRVIVSALVSEGRPGAGGWPLLAETFGIEAP